MPGSSSPVGEAASGFDVSGSAFRWGANSLLDIGSARPAQERPFRAVLDGKAALRQFGAQRVGLGEVAFSARAFARCHELQGLRTALNGAVRPPIEPEHAPELCD